MGNTAMAPDRVSATSDTCPTSTLLPPGLLASSAHLRAILRSMRSLPETVEVVLHRSEKETLIHLCCENTFVELDLADDLIVQILDL